jgi:DNA-binding protein Fis
MLAAPAGNVAAMSLEEVEKHHILRVLQYVKGNKTKAAEILQIGLTTLYNKLKEYNIPA